jgi:quercetin dioxygenase-like cupin family protein
MRRIVTGHDENEVAKVVIDDVPANTRRSASGTSSTLIWCTDRTPADISIGENIEDMGARKIGTPPPANGTRFAVLEFAPGSVSPLHRTETIDYVVVISGELEMDLDDSTIRLRAGDVLVQRGTNHSWRNPTDTPARAAFVLVDAAPLGIGRPVSRDGVASAQTSSGSRSRSAS